MSAEVTDHGAGVWSAVVHESLPENIDLVMEKRLLRVSGHKLDVQGRIAVQLIDANGQIVGGLWVTPADFLALAREIEQREEANGNGTGDSHQEGNGRG